MKVLENKHKRKIFIIMTSIVLLIAILIATCVIYINDYYHADMDAIEAFVSTSEVDYRTLEDNTIVFEPNKATKGFIFYPGGKVEYTAYLPLMQACAEQGVLSVLVKMPFNLAVFDINAADEIQELYPQIEDWYIGGHSLGGSMAAFYISKYKENYEGLILLGSYSTENLSDTNLDVLSIYGSEDMVMNCEKYDKNKSNLPNNFTEVVINGGCHAYFGMYGLQDGDGTPTITPNEQIIMTAHAIANLINKTQ